MSILDIKTDWLFRHHNSYLITNFLVHYRFEDRIFFTILIKLLNSFKNLHPYTVPPAHPGERLVVDTTNNNWFNRG